MHPYGGTPKCPKCSKAVYAAEQTMGPGRKLYHKPCLACMTCNKRLDSYTLLEHDEQPYCKACHLKNFGTRNLRHANLPVAAPPSPTSPPAPATRRLSISNDLPRLKANRSLASSPVNANFPRGISPHRTNGAGGDVVGSSAGNYKRGSWGSARGSVTPPEEVEVRKALTLEEEAEDDVMQDEAQAPVATSVPAPAPRYSVDGLHHSEDAEPEAPIQSTSQSQPSQPSNTGRPGIGTIPRTIPLNLRHRTSNSLGTIPQESDLQEDHDHEYPGADVSMGMETPITDDVTPPSDPPSQPRRVSPPTPISPNTPTSPSALARHYTGTSSPTSSRGYAVPPMLKPTATGTRYGMALGGGGSGGGSYNGGSYSGGGVSLTGIPLGGTDTLPVQMTGTGSASGTPRRQWGTATPQCPRCAKSVYFAEQVKAVGKTFHKACLRCTQCNTTLDSNRLRDHDGDPYCVRCYGKNYGPQGSGYALLGKAGG